MHVLYIRKSSTFDQIISGSKSIEVRKQSKYLQGLKPHTFIMFVNGKRVYIKYITSIRLYDSLIKLLELNNLSDINNSLLSIPNSLTYYQQYYKNITGSFYAIYF